jgi:hypothetical protein
MNKYTGNVTNNVLRISIHYLFRVLNFMLPACRINISEAEPCISKIFCSILNFSLNSVNLIVALNDRKLNIIKRIKF